MRFPVPLTDDEQTLLRRAEEVLARQFNRLVEQKPISDPSMVGKLLQMRLAAHTREIFSVVLLDARYRILAVEDLHGGTIDSCEVHPRVVVQRALHHNASTLIIGHNHPSGSIEPSYSDRALTERIKTAAALFDISLLDSFVVGSSGFTSMAVRGWI